MQWVTKILMESPFDGILRLEPIMVEADTEEEAVKKFQEILGKDAKFRRYKSTLNTI